MPAVPVQKFRDVQRLYAAMTDGKMEYVLYGAENQTEINNYHVRLVAPAQMSDEEIMKFQSSLQEVMLFIKYSKDRENENSCMMSRRTGSERHDVAC